MSLSNTATPKYYKQFRDSVLQGQIPVCKEIAMEMNRIDDLIKNPAIYYDIGAVEGFIEKDSEKRLTFTEREMKESLERFRNKMEEKRQAEGNTPVEDNIEEDCDGQDIV